MKKPSQHAMLITILIVAYLSVALGLLVATIARDLLDDERTGTREQPRKIG